MDNKQFDVVALGELLIDFTQNGVSEQGNLLFEANPGGAPANVLAMLRKLGKRCAFIGKVGKDGFGDTLEKTVADAGIDTRGLKRDPEVHTTLAVVHTFPNGDRDFSFYRKPGADIMLRADELDEELLRSCRIFHFGTLSLTDEPCKGATVRAYELAKEAGALISFDPNLRPPLWPDEQSAKAAIEWGLARCDILKISDNEIEFMTGTSDFDKGAAILYERFPNIRLLNVTAGGDGSHSYYNGRHVFVPAWRNRDHRRGRHLLRERPQLSAGARDRQSLGRRSERDAALCQHRRLHRHDEEGRDPLHARARTGGRTVEENLSL